MGVWRKVGCGRGSRPYEVGGADRTRDGLKPTVSEAIHNRRDVELVIVGVLAGAAVVRVLLGGIYAWDSDAGLDDIVVALPRHPERARHQETRREKNEPAPTHVS